MNACGLGTMELDAIETQTVKQVLGDHAYRVPVVRSKRHLAMLLAASEPSNSSEPRRRWNTNSSHHAEFDHPDPNCDLIMFRGTGRVAHTSIAR